MSHEHVNDNIAHDLDGYKKQTFDEQISSLYRQTPAMLVVNMLVGAVLVYGLLPITPLALLFAWYSCLLTLTLVRVGLFYRFKNLSGAFNSNHYANLFTGTCALSGIVWGVGSLVFFQPEELQYQLLIFFILAGMGAGSVASLCTYKPAFFFYFLLSMTPLMIRFFLEGSRLHSILGFLALFFILALSFFALQINRSFVLSLTLRFENSHLVAKLREQKESAEQANQAKSKFLAAASHDLRQPLHALTLYTSILSENLEAPKNKKLAVQINRSIDALQSLFNALLDISRLEAGTLVPERRHFKLQTILERLINDYAGDALAKGIILTVVSNNLFAYSDASLVEQVLRNYLSNAMRYTNSGSISITCEEENGEITVSVKDTGIGVPEDQLKAIYGEFFQLRNPERDRSKGLGLGLAIVKRISELLEHPINVDSKVGEGSTFSITLPCGSEAHYIEPQSSNFWAEETASSSTQIAIIDDDIDVRESTEALFINWGCQVVSGSTPQEVLEKLEQDKLIPDLIVADYRLRGGRTGIGAIDLIKAKYGEDVAAIIITGDTASEPLQAIQTSGIPLINKPVPPAKLRSFLNSVQKR